MAEPTNGRRGALASLGERLIGALPPGMIVLVLLNVGTLGVVVWLFNANVDARNAMLTRIIDACLIERKER